MFGLLVQGLLWNKTEMNPTKYLFATVLWAYVVEIYAMPALCASTRLHSSYLLLCQYVCVFVLSIVKAFISADNRAHYLSFITAKKLKWTKNNIKPQEITAKYKIFAINIKKNIYNGNKTLHRVASIMREHSWKYAFHTYLHTNIVYTSYACVCVCVLA